MSEQITGTLADLKTLVQGTPAAGDASAAPRTPKRDQWGRSYATGRRKNAVARVWVKPGKGNMEINGKPVLTYFARPVLRMLLSQPFLVADRYEQFDVIATVTGGGLSGQAGAVRHGISRALTNYEPDLRPILKKAGFLTRDPRVVERKKYGKAKARRSLPVQQALNLLCEKGPGSDAGAFLQIGPQTTNSSSRVAPSISCSCPWSGEFPAPRRYWIRQVPLP